MLDTSKGFNGKIEVYEFRCGCVWTTRIPLAPKDRPKACSIHGASWYARRTEDEGWTYLER